MSNIPQDPAILLSYINTQLRDHYSSLEECCLSLCMNEEKVRAILDSINYHYDSEKNRFL